MYKQFLATSNVKDKIAAQKKSPKELQDIEIDVKMLMIEGAH